MITYFPRAASIPPRRAFPYPFAGTGTTRAPSRSAIDCDPSVLPLSAMRTSPRTPRFRKDCAAFSMQVARVSDSFRQGMTTENSGGSSSEVLVLSAWICMAACGPVIPSGERLRSGGVWYSTIISRLKILCYLLPCFFGPFHRTMGSGCREEGAFLRHSAGAARALLRVSAACRSDRGTRTAEGHPLHRPGPRVGRSFQDGRSFVDRGLLSRSERGRRRILQRRAPRRRRLGSRPR